MLEKGQKAPNFSELFQKLQSFPNIPNFLFARWCFQRNIKKVKTCAGVFTET